MLVLALDTTTRGGSCALARDGAIVGEEAGRADRTHGERLPDELMTLLAHTGVTLADIDLFAVATGPGSFTGLRVGIATMQGLAFAGRKPLLGVSALDALERLARAGVTPPAGAGAAVHRIATWVDAWRGEVYAALYESGREVQPPLVAAPRDLLPSLAGRPTRFIGDGADTYADVIREAIGAHAWIADPAAPLLAGTIAALASEQARAAAGRGALPLPHAIRPLYVRRPDPELVRERR